MLAEHDGTVVMRFAGCAACQQPPWYDAGLPEEPEQLARDALSRSATGTSRVIDPVLVLALAPFVAAGFSSYVSRQEQTWGMRRTSIDGFPTGPGWRIETWLRGSTAFGQARMQNDDGTRALGTLTKPQTQSSEQIASMLTHATPGVAPLIAVRTLGGHGLLLEREPDGTPLSTPMFPMPLMFAVPLFAQLAGILVDAAARGEVLRGLRPELVYFDRVNDAIAMTGIVPRASRFASGVGASLDLSPSFPFDSLYEAPELIRSEPAGARRGCVLGVCDAGVCPPAPLTVRSSGSDDAAARRDHHRSRPRAAAVAVEDRCRAARWARSGSGAATERRRPRRDPRERVKLALERAQPR